MVYFQISSADNQIRLLRMPSREILRSISGIKVCFLKELPKRACCLLNILCVKLFSIISICCMVYFVDVMMNF